MKKKLFLPLIIIVCLFLFSCKSVSTDLIPFWVWETPRSFGHIIYVGVGHGSTLNIAKDAAYLDVLDKMSNDLGYNITNQYFKDFINSDKIIELGTKVIDSYSSTGNGIYTYYIETSTPSHSFLSSRSPEYQRLIERENKIEKLLEESLNYYKENKDVESVNSILEAIPIAASGEIKNPEYIVSALVNRANEILANIKISFKKEKNNTSEVTVIVKRMKGLFHPRVIDAEIKASYLMEIDNGNITESWFIGKTDDKGQFFFNKTNPFALREGEIGFSVYLDQEALNKAIEATDEETIAPIIATIETGESFHHYLEKESLATDDLIIALAEYDINGQIRNSNIALDAFETYLEETGIRGLSITKIEGDDWLEILDQLMRIFPKKRYYIIVRVGLTDYRENTGLYFAKSEGRLVIYDKNKSEEPSINDSSSIGYSQEMKDAENEALEKEARVLASTLLEFL